MADKPTTPSENLSISQPVEATTSPAPQMIDISRIQPYEHNPRHGRNPEYDRIRDSSRIPVWTNLWWSRSAQMRLTLSSMPVVIRG
ncbi:MAG: hypothetical protein N0E48_24680 [Candidatus Thiodiazotropha endolucinida]|nr:hypothetical protein [Candidatus Thiodiazotropha taylori]MCW4346524.1 hypothetical protein [Candidatus Thiodiazotropha endolucinida]